MSESEKLDLETVHHIMVWMPNWIGDVVFALPSIQALRARFRQVRITVVVRPPADQFLSHHPDIDSVIRIPFTRKDGVLALIRFALSLRKYHFDLAVIFPNSLRSALLAFLTAAKIRLGYDTESRGFLLTHPVKVELDSKKVHGVDYYGHLLRRLGIETPLERRFPELVTTGEMKSQRDLLKRLGVERHDLLVAVAPGASKPEKRWHSERFGILCQKMVKERGAKVVLLGSKGEAPLIGEIARFCPGKNVFPLTGLHLQVVLGILKNCRLLVANDSGMMNLAAMVGTPVVVIFGPGNTQTTDPCIAPEKKEIVSKHFPCSPCRHNFFKECEPSPHNKPYCIEDISVREVSEAVDRLLLRLA